jgi:hypothetical protein
LRKLSLNQSRDLCKEQSGHAAPFRSLLSKAGETVCLLVVLVWLWPHQLLGAPVSVRFLEGSLHAFLALRSLDGTFLATGDLVQIRRSRTIESRTTFHFKDGSIFDERVIFTQQRVFKLEDYHLIYSGAAFASDADFSLNRTFGKYRVKTKRHEDGKEEVLDGSLNLPLDVYIGGMVLIVAKNLSNEAGETVHTVAFTPTPRLIQLELLPAGQHKALVGQLTMNTTHFVIKPHLGAWLKLISKLVGQTPPDSHTWIAFDQVPAFVKFEGPLYMAGPAWRIELLSPRWQD